MSTLAFYSYDDEWPYNPALSDIGFVVTREVDDGEMSALVGHDSSNSMNFVAVRGTETDTFEDVAVDLDLRLRPVSGLGNLHTGFHDYGRSVASNVRQDVVSSCQAGVDGTKKPLWLTGHSLGGAGAVIAAKLLADQGCNVAGVVSFGSPRMGDLQFIQIYDSTVVNGVSLGQRTHRWVHGNDPMYCVPPGGNVGHPGVESRIDAGVRIDTSRSESKCDDPDDWIAGLRTGLALVDPVIFGLTPLMLDAFLAFLNGIIDLVVHCEPGFGFDDFATLGGCTIIDANGVIQSYGTDPYELLETVIRTLAFFGDHSMENYTGGLGNVDWDDGLDWVDMRVYVEPRDASLQTYVIEPNTNQFCVADPTTDGRLYCDFQVPVGYDVQFAVGGQLAVEAFPQEVDLEGEGCRFVDHDTYADGVCQVRVTNAGQVVTIRPVIVLL